MYRECLDCFWHDDESRFVDGDCMPFKCPICDSVRTLGVSEHPELRGEVE